MRSKLAANLFLVAGAAASLFDPPRVQHAEPTTLIFLGAIALAIAANYMLKPKVPGPQRDTRPPSTSTRGDQLPYVLGRRTVSPLVLWVGRRNEREGGKHGKKGGAGGAGKQLVYAEDGWHGVCLGPANKLHAIRVGSKVVFQGPITPGDTPSGSVLQTTEGDSFRWFWGEHHQPIIDNLAGADALGVSSRWPGVCGAVWIQRQLGSSAVWPQIDYEMEATCVGFTLPDSDCHFEETTSGAKDGGINGAHAIYQLTTGRFPYGVGMDPADIDFGSLKALGRLMQTERIPQNILIASKTTLPAILDNILADMGVMLVQEQGKLLFMPIRTEGSPPNLDDRVVVIPAPSFDINHGTVAFTDAHFLFPDVTLQNHDNDVLVSNDGTTRLLRKKNISTTRLETITDGATAAKVASRRAQLLTNDAANTSFKVCRTARMLVVGQVVTVPGVGTVRVTGVTRSGLNDTADIDASIEQYSVGRTEWVPTNPVPSPDSGTPTADDLVIPLELPHDFVGEVLRIGVVRVRLDGTSSQAAVWVSTNGTSYTQVGVQNATAAGGTLLDPLPERTRTILDVGPRISATTAAMNKVRDLSGDENAWLSCSQVCIIGSEFLALQRITAVGGGYALDGLVRGRAGSLNTEHLPGQTPLVAILDADAITAFGDLSWAPGQTLYIKVQPAGVPLDEITAVPLMLKGLAFSPLPVDNLRPLSRATGAGCNFTWTDRIRRGTGCGAGEGLPGAPIGPIPDAEGDYVVEILDAAMRVKRIVGVSSPTYNYTFGTMHTDIPDDDTFFVRITNTRNSYAGYPRTFRIEGTAE